MEDYFDRETLQEKCDDLQETYKVMSVEFESNTNSIEEITKIQERNEMEQRSLLLKFKKFTNFMSESCLVQTIAVLICIIIILLLKL